MAGEHVFVAMTPPIAMNERLLIERVIAGVHGAEDGTPAHDE